jgi:hypothetical protein
MYNVIIFKKVSHIRKKYLLTLKSVAGAFLYDPKGCGVSCF